MFRNAFIISLVALSPIVISAPVSAQAAPTFAAKYSTADTTIGDLLDNAATKAVLDKLMPGFSTNPQVEMARGMTLRAVQPMAPDQIKIETLDLVDADLAKIH